MLSAVFVELDLDVRVETAEESLKEWFQVVSHVREPSSKDCVCKHQGC